MYIFCNEVNNSKANHLRKSHAPSKNSAANPNTSISNQRYLQQKITGKIFRLLAPPLAIKFYSKVTQRVVFCKAFNIR